MHSLQGGGRGGSETWLHERETFRAWHQWLEGIRADHRAGLMIQGFLPVGGFL
jgi:hypothetical protein